MKASPTAASKVITPTQQRISGFFPPKAQSSLPQCSTGKPHSTSAAPASTSDLASADNAETQGKVPKPSATEVANKLFGVLLVSEPLNLLDICKRLPDLPRESVQSVLEVLQVLGLVIQSTCIKDPSSSKASSATALISLYSVTDYAKCSAAFPIANLEAELKSKLDSRKEVDARNRILQELTDALDDESLTMEQRNTMLKDTVEKVLTRYPQLWEDPLYQALIQALGCSAQPIASPAVQS